MAGCLRFAMSRPLVDRPEDLSANAVAFLRERCELVQCPAGDEVRFAEVIGRADALVVRTYTRVDGTLLARAPRLKVVGCAGVGLDSIDVEACKARDVARRVHARCKLTSGGRVRVRDALRLCFGRACSQPALPTSEWNTLRRELSCCGELGSLTLGVLGLGRIGSRVARIGAGFGMRVFYHDVREIAEDDRWGAESLSQECVRGERRHFHPDASTTDPPTATL